MENHEFNQLYPKIKSRVERTAKSWERSRQYYVENTWEDFAQEMWIAILALPPLLDHTFYITFAKEEAERLCRPNRYWKDGTGHWEKTTPVNPFTMETFHTLIGVDGVYDRVETDVYLNRVLTHRQRGIYDLIKFDKGLSEKEKRGKRGEHCTGWTQEEIGSMFEISRQAVQIEIKAIMNALRDLADERSRERHKEVDGSKRVCKSTSCN
jgi:hypothetical protein